MVRVIKLYYHEARRLIMFIINYRPMGYIAVAVSESGWWR